jgi:uncharacterized membrane protein YhaH (DUF805 family)
MATLFNFSRNCPRSEFWLVQILGSLLALMFVGLMTSSPNGSIGVMIGLLANIAIMVAMLAALVSRIRDAGYSVLWLIACFVPYFGLIAWIIFGCLETKKA